MIGIFDSGVGGLTVVRELRRQLPNCPFLYLGDTARTPYGNKSQETIIRYAIEDAQFLVDQGAEAIVVACNTASSVAIEALKEKFKTPIYGVIEPAVKKAVEISRGRVGIIGTQATISSNIYPQKIKNKNNQLKVYSQACPLLVPLVEENWISRPETKIIVRRYLTPLRQKNIDTLILGCTHYPLLKKVIQTKIGRQVELVDSAEEVVEALKNSSPSFLRRGLGGGKIASSRFFVTDLTPKFQQVAEKWLGDRIKAYSVKLSEVKNI